MCVFMHLNMILLPGFLVQTLTKHHNQLLVHKLRGNLLSKHTEHFFLFNKQNINRHIRIFYLIFFNNMDSKALKKRGKNDLAFSYILHNDRTFDLYVNYNMQIVTPRAMRILGGEVEGWGVGGGNVNIA